MGTWGKGAFENDAAADLIRDLMDSTSAVDTVRAAFAEAIDAGPNDYLDIDVGQFCVAASELIALAFGDGRAPSGLESIVEALKAEPALVQTALKALPRVFDCRRSELAQTWGSAEPFEPLYERLVATCDDAS